jgi:flagellar biosynthesis protein FlhF
MRIKSYFSGTVESAMELARRELGDEAVILNSRAAPPEARHLGAYEVVFGVDDTVPVQVAAEEQPVARGHRFELLEGEIVALRHELRKMSRGILAPANHWRVDNLPSPDANQEDRELNAYLVRRDLPESAARELLRRGRARLRLGPATGSSWRIGAPMNAGRPGLFAEAGGVFPAHPGVLAGLLADESRLTASVLEELAAALRVDATLGRPGAPSRIVALVGSAGAGKTTTLVKLAAHYGLRARRPAHIISTDNVRVGATEQLRAYAAILGMGFDLAETTVALGQLLNEHAHKELILIDTPGLSPGQMSDHATMAHFLSSDPRIDCHLVMPANQKGADVARMIERFHSYGAHKVILTHLDETESIGGLLLALDECEQHVSFLAMGQTIPEDLEPATIARLLDLFVGDPPMGSFFTGAEPLQEHRATAGSRA